MYHRDQGTSTGGNLAKLDISLAAHFSDHESQVMWCNIKCYDEVALDIYTWLLLKQWHIEGFICIDRIIIIGKCVETIFFGAFQPFT